METKSKYALCIFMNEKYIVPFKVFLSSLYVTNPDYANHDVVILHTDLSDEDKATMTQFCPRAVFLPVLTDNYKNVNPKKVLYAYLIPTFYKLDVFRIEGYEKVMMIDVDMLVYKRFEPDPFTFEGEILMCDDGIKNMFNSGLVIIDSAHLNEKTYNGVLDEVKKDPSLPDQVIINDYFKGRITRLPHRYNVTSPILKIIKKDHITIFHYAGKYKPWSSNLRSRYFMDWQNYASHIGVKY